MLLCDPVIVINHPLPQSSVGEQLDRLVSGFFDDLIFHPGQACLIIIPDLISKRDDLEIFILYVLFVNRVFKYQQGKFGFYRFKELVSPSFPETGVGYQIRCWLSVPERIYLLIFPG